MNFNILGINISISYPFLAVITAFFLVDKTGLGCQMLFAAMLHECGHLVVMHLFKQPVCGIYFVAFGIRICRQSTTALSYKKEALLFLAGPFVNFLAALLIAVKQNSLTQLAQVHLLLGLFNLLPIDALDGGMIVRNLALCFTSPRAAMLVSRAVSVLFLIAIAVIETFLVLHEKGNITLMVTCIYLAMGLLRNNKTC